ncbi:MAG: MBL fold metallo-hydrolase [Clostridia bacterium]|nr:MBL fold metallo-hydrolase [Clostridia bacterium]
MASNSSLSFEMQVSAALEEAFAMTAESSCNTAKITKDTVKRSKTADNTVETVKKHPTSSQDYEKERENAKNAVNHGEMSSENADGRNVRRIVSLASGSRANCTLIEGGGTRILIDFGLSCRMLGSFLKKYGLMISDIDAVFITHEHSDHVGGLTTFFKKYDIPVHMTEPSFLSYTRRSGFEYRDRITVHEVEYETKIGGFTVSSCEVSHDSAACVSYLVTGNGISFCTCTDLGFVPERVFKHVSRAENVIFESNHDVTLLETGEYPDELKRRIRSRNGHLSNAQCDDVLVRLVDAGVKRILLGHISPENNDPSLALHAAILALEKAGRSVEFIGAAPRLEPIVLIEEKNTASTR